MFMGLVGWIVLGTIVGFIASKVIPLRGDDPKIGVALGGIGAVIGGWMYSLFSGSEVTYFNGKSLMFALIVSLGALVVWHGWRWKAAG